VKTQQPTTLDRLSDFAAEQAIVALRRAAAPALKAAEPVLEELTGNEASMSAAFLRHYVDGSGTPFSPAVPDDWQDWIVRKTRGATGKHKMDPYRSDGIFDMRNALGHFTVDVSRNSNGTKTYTIKDQYAFPYIDDNGKVLRHGFGLGAAPPEKVEALKRALPSYAFPTPDNKVEKFEIKRLGRERTETLLIPWYVLNALGKAYPVETQFTR
jgi:hypothetical protein